MIAYQCKMSTLILQSNNLQCIIKMYYYCRISSSHVQYLASCYMRLLSIDMGFRHGLLIKMYCLHSKKGFVHYCIILQYSLRHPRKMQCAAKFVSSASGQKACSARAIRVTGTISWLQFQDNLVHCSAQFAKMDASNCHLKQYFFLHRLRIVHC